MGQSRFACSCAPIQGRLWALAGSTTKTHQTARRWPVLLAFALVAAGMIWGPLEAQQAPFTQPVDSGTLVRLQRRSDGEIVIRLVSRLTPEADTVFGCRYASPLCFNYRPEARLAIPMADIRGVALQRGTHVVQGAAIGTLVGLVAGLLSGSLVRLVGVSSDTPGANNGAREGASLLFGGAMIGALIGALSPVWVDAK